MEPNFSGANVQFGLLEDEVAVVVMLEHNENVLYWEFRALFKGDTSHHKNWSLEATASLDNMEWDLIRTEVAPDA